MATSSRASGSFWRRLCRSLCREQGAKDAAMVALVAVVLGAMAFQLGLGGIRSGPRRQVPAAPLRA